MAKTEYKTYLTAQNLEFLLSRPANERSEIINMCLERYVAGEASDLQRFGEFIASDDPDLAGKIAAFYSIKPSKPGRPPNEVLTESERARFGTRKGRTRLQQAELEHYSNTWTQHQGDVQTWEQIRYAKKEP